MTQRAELERRVQAMSEAEVHTVLKFVQFLEEGHVRPHLADPRALMKQAKVIIDDLVEIVDLIEQPQGPPAGLLDGAVEIPRAEWRTLLDGFSHVYHDQRCRLWAKPEIGEARTLAEGTPLGQIYLDEKGSERDAVQVALNRSGSTYSDFRFIHRVASPRAIYLKECADGQEADLIVESDGTTTVLEIDVPKPIAPGLRNLAFLALLRERAVAGEA